MQIKKKTMRKKDKLKLMDQQARDQPLIYDWAVNAEIQFELKMIKFFS